MSSYNVIISGGGISGLSFAHSCSQAGVQALLLEKGNRIGGCFHSHHFTGEAEGFWVELGAHTCYNSYSQFIKILEERDLLSLLLPRQKVPFLIRANSGLASIPSQLNFLELILSL